MADDDSALTFELENLGFDLWRGLILTGRQLQQGQPGRLTELIIESLNEMFEAEANKYGVDLKAIRAAGGGTTIAEENVIGGLLVEFAFRLKGKTFNPADPKI